MNVLTNSGSNLVQANRESETQRLQLLHAIERKVLWLSTWMIHNANHIRAEPGRAEGRRPPGVERLGRRP